MPHLNHRRDLLPREPPHVELRALRDKPRKRVLRERQLRQAAHQVSQRCRVEFGQLDLGCVDRDHQQGIVVDAGHRKRGGSAGGAARADEQGISSVEVELAELYWR
eukprot:256355-Chlamydomonas_euryale.AAC.1